LRAFSILFVVLLTSSALGVSPLARSQQPEYVIIKAAFHLHTVYSPSEGNMTPTQLVEAFAAAGYNCISVTDHSTELNDTAYLADIAEAKGEGDRLGVIVIGGEEIIDQFPPEDGVAVWKHILALFLDEYIPNVGSTFQTNNVQPYFDAIHSQGGIGIVAHSWMLNDQMTVGSSNSPWWQYINSSFADGWEIFNWGPGMSEDEIATVIDKGRAYVASDDFGGIGRVPVNEYNILFCQNATEAGVEDALINQRNVVYHYGEVFGSQQAMALYREYFPVASVCIQHSYIGDLNVTVGVGSSFAPSWSRLVWNRLDGRGSGYLNLTIDLSDALAYLPPSNSTPWFLKVYDAASSDEGTILNFTISCQNQTYLSEDVPVPVSDFQTSYTYIPSASAAPPVPSANIYVQHSWVSDLKITIGVGRTSAPMWSRLVWNRVGAKGPGYVNLTVDLSDATAYLPLSNTTTWFLKVYDAAGGDQGDITSFTVTYLWQTYASQDVPVPVLDFQTSYAYIPSAEAVPMEPSAMVYIQHTYISDLNVTLGVGSPSAPFWSQSIWNRTGGRGSGYLNLTVDLSTAVAYLPPSANSTWFLRVYDGAAGDAGNIISFTITYENQTYVSQDVPVAISDFQTSYANIPPAPLAPVAHVYIQHTYIGDLIVDVGVGNPLFPTWSKRIWNGAGGSTHDLNLTADLTDAVAYLPPSVNNTWFLRIYDKAKGDTGTIVQFAIDYMNDTYATTDVPVFISDFKTSYAFIPSGPAPPPPPSANVIIQHSYVGDLNVTIGVGSPSSPLWSQVIWNRAGGRGTGSLNLTVDLSTAVAYLPPSANSTWFLRVYDGAAGDTGTITSFTITYQNQTYVSQDVPTSVYDFQTSYACIPSGIPRAKIFIQHTYIGDLKVTVGVGASPTPWSAPLWSQVIWNRTGGSTQDLNLTVSLLDAVNYLPPSQNLTWYLQVYDGATGDQGQILEFAITFQGTTYTSPDINPPVPVYDFKTSYAAISG
jgi:subtilisin-like proprotein convertase family protein